MDGDYVYVRIFFDLSRAFNSIASNFIESKLNNLGFQNIFLSWLISFFSIPRICAKGSRCSHFLIQTGIRSSSRFRPGTSIFILCRNDLPYNIMADLFVLVIPCRTLVENFKTCCHETDSF